MSSGGEKTKAHAEMLANRLQKRFRHLKKWAQRTKAGVFRLYDKDIPEIPLVLDFYGDSGNLREAALAGALYKRPYEKSEDDEEQWLSAMKESASLALGIEPDRIFLKQRKKQKGALQYEKFSNANFIKIIGEKGLTFRVNLSDYLDCGLFPDRRLLRDMIRSEAGGKTVLNLFSYTGSFSVYAASGGCVSTDSVDLSNTYLNWARENFSFNGFSASIFPHMEDFFKEKDGKIEKQRNRLIRADVISFLEKAALKGIKRDIIIVDPPAFSNSKKMTGNFDLQRDLIELLGQCARLLSEDGKIFLSVNTRRPAITADETEKKLRLRVTDLTNKVTDEDFIGKKTPRSFLICR